MSIGVSQEMFWGLNPSTLKPYEEAEKIRMQKQNIMAHRQGAYFFNAISVVLSNAFASKGAQPQHYMEEPLKIFPPTEEEKAQEVEIERQKTIAYFSSMIPIKEDN